MVLTKQDLQEWNSHPVTQAVFKNIKLAMDELALESVLMPTSDQTAMKAARHEGILEGAGSLLESYEVALEEAG